MGMKKTPVEQVVGAFVYDIDRYEDNRGFFQEVQNCNKQTFYSWQTNVSKSKKNVIRGMHSVPFSKLCTCVRGRLYDVVADVREGSPTFGNWFGIWLSEDNCKQLFVPSGCAHGFFSAEDDTILLYGQDGTYNPEREFEVNWMDPTLGIEWPDADEYVMSDKDKSAKMLSER